MASEAEREAGRVALGAAGRVGVSDCVSARDRGFVEAEALGIKPCGGCARRAAALNRWLVFSGRRN